MATYIKRLRFDYINHEDEDEERVVNPIRMYYGSKLPWYPEPTWLMSAYDINHHGLRDFQVIKMRNIRED